MSLELSTALQQHGGVSAAALDEALQRQVVFGGSLDTILLESGAIDEASLLEALAAAYDLPAAGKREIDQIGGHIPRLFPLVFAETYHLVPYRLVEQDFWVLVNGAPDEQLFARIKERLQLNLLPTVTTEARLHYAMHRLYGTALLPRFQNLVQKLDGEAGKSRAPASSAASEHVLSWGLSSAPIAPTRSRGDKKRPGLDVRGLLARLDAATDRDSIVEILLGATLAIFEFAGLFLVQGETVNGWRSTTADATQKLVRISLGVELPSVFQTIYATGGHYLGPLPVNSVNQKLLADMGRTPPRAALLAPINVGGKLAAILYADNGSKGVPSKRVAAVLLLAQRAGMGLEALIRRRKQTVPAPQEAPSAVAPHVPEAGDEAWVVDDSHIELIPEEPAAPAAALPVDAAAIAEAEPNDATPPPPPGPSERWSAVQLEEIPVEQPVPELLDEEELLADEVHIDKSEDDGYTAFADVNEDADSALDDWQDVLVEASGIETATASKKKAAPPTVTWDDVIAEAERAQTLMQARAPESIEVAGTVVDEREILFDTLEAQDPEVRRGAIERLLALGESLDDELRARFPGRLDNNPLAAEVKLLPFRRCSGLCELIAARGASAAPVVLPHLESDDPVKRLFAIYYLHAVPYPPALGALARRLYDTEPRNRYLAADALRTYAREAGYAHIVQGLRDQLKVPILESQVATAQVLGQLRDPSAVPSLIPLVVAPRAELSGASASALAVICGQAFGADVAKWAEWWRTHYNRPRAAWLIESLRHPNPAIVRIAHSELVLLSGKSVPLDPDGPAQQREAAVRAWEAWWQQVARPATVTTAPAES